MVRGRLEKEHKGEGFHYVYDVRIIGVKSIEDARIPLKPDMNVLMGRNSSGKTNIWEVIYFHYTSPVIVSTHSPIVVDLAGPERVCS